MTWAKAGLQRWQEVGGRQVVHQSTGDEPFQQILVAVLADTTQFGRLFHVFTTLLVKPNFHRSYIYI